jgi:hypothetical protein
VNRIKAKTACVARVKSHRSGGGRLTLFLYHARKAAGTTLRAFLETQCAGTFGGSSKGGQLRFGRGGGGGDKGSKSCLKECEGMTLDPVLMSIANRRKVGETVITITSLRQPIDRALSLYWYEHVGWWDGIKHEPDKIKTLAAWLEHWRDLTPWKHAFGLANPGK